MRLVGLVREMRRDGEREEEEENRRMGIEEKSIV